MIRILYISKATSAFGPADIPAVLEKSIANNTAQGITGVLCYRGGYFAQILEGEELPVLETYTHIARDKRHTDLVIIHLATTTKQLFQGWAMGGIAEKLNPFIDVRDILRLRNSPGEQAWRNGFDATLARNAEHPIRNPPPGEPELRRPFTQRRQGADRHNLPAPYQSSLITIRFRPTRRFNSSRRCPLIPTISAI